MANVFQDGADQLTYYLLGRVEQERTWDPQHDAKPLVERLHAEGLLRKVSNGYQLNAAGKAWLTKARASLRAEALRAPRGRRPVPARTSQPARRARS